MIIRLVLEPGRCVWVLPALPLTSVQFKSLGLDLSFCRVGILIPHPCEDEYLEHLGQCWMASAGKLCLHLVERLLKGGSQEV